MRSLFFNPELNYLRAGWRIGIFVLILVASTIVIGLPSIMILQQIVGVKSMALQMFFSYAALTVATWIMLRFLDRRPFRSVGLHFEAPWLSQLVKGILLGGGMMTVIFAVFYFSGMVTVEFRELDTVQMLFIFSNSLFLYVVVGYGEELMFRGYLFQTFVEGTNKVIATVTISVLFALAHANNPNASTFGLVNVGLAGIWLSIAYFRTESLWLPIGLHFSWNFFQGFVYSMPVSGTTSMKEQIGTAIINGPEWLTGGSFGPEGGALATVILIAGTALIYRSSWFDPSITAWKYHQWKDERRKALEMDTVEQIQSVE
jgi:hypothetical protein